MRFLLLAIALVLVAGCARSRPFKPGTVYMTVPQTREYVELGKVEGSSYAYGDRENVATHEALAKATRLGADAIVGVRAKDNCVWILFWLIGAIGIPPCSTAVEAAAVKWTDANPPTPTEPSSL